MNRTAVLLALATACGEIAPGTYLGRPQLTIDVHISLMGGGGVGGPSGRLGLFWQPQALSMTTTNAIDQLVEQPSNDLNVALPDNITWSIYDLPEPQDFVSGAGYAIGSVFVYDDSNGNGRYDSGERVLADAPQAAILYVPHALDAARSPSGGPIPAGFHIITLPLSCGPLMTSSPEGTNCGVELGAPCSSNTDCGADGTCLTDQFLLAWQGGYCAIASPPPAGCIPDGRFLPDAQSSQNPQDMPGGWFLKPCTTNADCVTPLNPIMQCDFGQFACMPTKTLVLVQQAVQPLPVCMPTMMP